MVQLQYLGVEAREAPTLPERVDTHAVNVNARQRSYLRTVLRRAFPARRPVQHDFACGDGRAIRLLHGSVRMAHGYDTSPAQLARAREGGVYADLHRIDFEGPLPDPATLDGPAVVTTFRLSRHPDEVRHRAVAFAAEILTSPRAGLLVVENDGNRHAELSHGTVEKLLSWQGFEILERRGFAVCPPGGYRHGWLRPFARRIDNLTSRHVTLAGWCTTVLYVARRRPHRRGVPGRRSG